MDNIKKILGSRIRQARLNKGWTIEQLAEMIDLTPSSLGLVERANRALSIEKLYLVAKTLEVPIDSLLKSDEDLANSKCQRLGALAENLDDTEFEFVMDIVATMKMNFKKKSGNA